MTVADPIPVQPSPPDAVLKRSRTTSEPARPRMSGAMAHLVILLALTAVAGLLRFSYIDKPPLWGDEAWTYGRICGTYNDLLNRLEQDGFGPLHYTLYWWIADGLPTNFHIAESIVPRAGGREVIQRTVTTSGHLVPGGVNMTPLMMRLVPALAGVLMVPAMYWLARMLVSRNAALYAAVFVAFSAYLLNYSRDAKMYMHFWLFVTLSMAAFLWWLKSRGVLPWLTWVACSLVMVGFHTIGLVILLVQMIFLFTSRHHHFGSFLVLIPTVLYLPFIALSAPFRWARWEFLGARGPVGRFLNRAHDGFRWPAILMFVLGAGIVGAGPAVYYFNFNQWVDRVADDRRDSLAWNQTGVQWVQTYNAGRGGPDLLLFTSTAFLYNWEWPRNFPDQRINDEAEILPRTLRLLKASAVVLLFIGLIALLPFPHEWTAVPSGIDRPHPPWRSAMWLLIWVCVPAYAFYCASIRNYHAPLEWFGSLLLINPPDVSFPHVQYGKGLADTLRLWFTTGSLPDFARSFGTQLVTLTSAFRPSNMHWEGIAGVAIALGWLALHFFMAGSTWSRRFIRFTAAVLMVAGVFLLLQAVYCLIPESLPGSVWMPRYLGFTFPAIAIIVGVMLTRLPTLPIRATAVVALVGINLAVFGSRVFAGSEPPTDVQARDFLLSAYDRPESATVRTYFQPFRGNVAPPGGGALIGSMGGAVDMVSHQGRYYLSVMSDRRATPYDFTFRMPPGTMRRPQDYADRNFRWWVYRANIDQNVAADVGRFPNLQRIIVWDTIRATDVSGRDELLERLGQRWRRVSLEEFVARDHWTWRALSKHRRREYVRLEPEPPPPPPATQPATQPVRPPATRPATQPVTRPAATRPATAAPTTRAATQPVTRPAQVPPATTQASVQPPATAPAAQATTQPTTRAALVPSTQPAVVTATQPTAVPVTQPVAMPSTQPSSPPATGPGTAATQPAQKPEMMVEPTPEKPPATQPVQSPVPATQPAAQPAPATQPTTSPSTQPAGQN